MKLFVVGLRRYFGYQIELEEMDNNRTKLIIPNLVKNDSTYEKIEFILPTDKQDILDSGNLNIDCSRLKTKGNKYIFEETARDGSRIVYALLHNPKCVPSDVYLPTNMKSKVEVLRKIRFYDVEPDYGDYIAHAYFVKINLLPVDTIPFYLESKNAEYLSDHLVFIRDYLDIATANYKTYIILNEENKKEYVSLSEL